MADEVLKGFQRKLEKNKCVISGFALNFGSRLPLSNHIFGNACLSQGIAG
jgi:hypothetical protein